MPEEQDGLTFSEPANPPPAPDASAPQQATIDPALELENLRRSVTSSGSWFYWLAGLSLLNTVIVLFHGSMRMLFGLGITQMFDSILMEYGSASAVFAIPASVLFAGVYVVFGYFACRRAKWAFIAGLICYCLDAGISLLGSDWLGAAFHAWVIFRLAAGMKALSMAERLEKATAVTDQGL